MLRLIAIVQRQLDCKTAAQTLSALDGLCGRVPFVHHGL